MKLASTAQRRAIFATEAGQGRSPRVLTEGMLLKNAGPKVAPISPAIPPVSTLGGPGTPASTAKLTSPLVLGGQFRRVR